MQLTTNYALNKPEQTDVVNIDDLNGNMDILDTELKKAQDKADQAFQSASNGKAVIKNAITGVDPEVLVPDNATFAQLADCISQIQTGVDTGDATATAAQILAGMTAYVKGVKVTGTIPSKGAATYTPGTSNQTIPAGQYLKEVQTIAGDADLVSANIRAGVNIFGVAGNSNVVDTSGGDAIAANILSGKKACVKGVLVTGNIPSKEAATITPGTTNQTIAAGQYLNGAQTILGDADLTPANILSGKNIFGVVGSAIAGKRSASGTANSGTTMVNGLKLGDGSGLMCYKITVSGLTFTPSIIIAIPVISGTLTNEKARMTIYTPQAINFTDYPNIDVLISPIYYAKTGNTSYPERYGASLADNTALFYVNSSGFSLPVTGSNTDYYWIAIE